MQHQTQGREVDQAAAVAEEEEVEEAGVARPQLPIKTKEEEEEEADQVSVVLKEEGEGGRHSMHLLCTSPLTPT